MRNILIVWKQFRRAVNVGKSTLTEFFGRGILTLYVVSRLFFYLERRMKMSDIKRRDNKGRILQTGEIQKKDGSYSYKYTDALGNRKELTSWRLTNADVTPPNKKHKASLREQEKEVRRLQDRGICSNGITVLELVDRYIATKVNVTHNTKAGYKTVRNILSKEEFGAKRIDHVKYSEARSFLIKLQSDGYRYSSVQNVRGVLRPAFEMAFRDEMIISNPFQFELADALINDSIKREALSKENERKFLKFVKEDKHFSRYYEGIYILFNTGIRISEFCGLTISDIDFKKHTFMVDHQLQRERNGKYVIVDTKTDAGVRELPMSKEVEECFRSIIANRPKQEPEPMIDGKIGFLFFDKNNNPMVAMHWEKYFQHIREKYNKIYKVQMPLVTPHVCRHTYCSDMARSGINPSTLKYLMGHSDINVTLNVYTHIDIEDAKADIKKSKKETTKGKTRAAKSGSKVVNF